MMQVMSESAPHTKYKDSVMVSISEQLYPARPGILERDKCRAWRRFGKGRKGRKVRDRRSLSLSCPM